jgi:mono/diheme cytochrome c family protein
MKRSSLYLYLVAFVAIILSSCSKPDGQFTGREYMPDMAHSIAKEANYSTYYQFNTWGGKEAYRNFFAELNLPVKGTIPFNAAKMEQKSRGLTFPQYHFPNTDAGRDSAMALILENPLRPKTPEELATILEQGGNLYNIYCGSCHGENGDGNGQLYNSGKGPYPAAPANYLKEEFMNAPEGRFYHAIMHGKNVMLSHADKLSHDERWMVIHYIRALQAKEKKVDYDLDAALAGHSATVKAPDSTATTTKTKEGE